MKIRPKRSVHQDRIVHVARKQILRASFAEMRTRDVAREAGVSEATIVRSVGTKPQLVQASHADVWDSHLWPDISARANAFPDDAAAQVIEIADTLWSRYQDPLFRDTLMLAMMHCAAADLFISRAISLSPDGNTKYVALMDTLAKRIVKARQALPGMTKDFLREAILGTIDGVLIGWYSADKAQCPETKISHEQAIAGLRALVSARSSMSRAWFSPKRSESVQIAFELE